jgi:hypothetical protein
VDGKFLRERHLIFERYIINQPLDLFHKVVRISDYPCGGFNISIG